MRPIFFFFMLFYSAECSFFSSFAGASSTPSPLQYRAYGGCSSSGCIPPTIVPMSSGFWPNADVLVGLQTQEQLQNQQQVQRDASSGGSGGLVSGGQIQSTSTPSPVIYIARAGSDHYKYSVSSSTPSPVGSGVGWNSGGAQGAQGSFGNTGNQIQNQNQGSSQLSANTNIGGQSPFQQQGSSGFNGQNTQNQGSSGFQNVQNPFNQGSSGGQLGSGSQNPFGSSNGNFGTSSGSTNQFGNSGNVASPQNAQNAQGSFGGPSGSSGSPSNGNNNLPFGPNVVSANSQFGPLSAGQSSQPFSENDWNFHPGSQGVHFVGDAGAGQSGRGSGGGMSEEARQIAVQIQAIRDNLSITRDESNYLISQLKASLPPDLQNQLQSV